MIVPSETVAIPEMVASLLVSGPEGHSLSAVKTEVPLPAQPPRYLKYLFKKYRKFDARKSDAELDEELAEFLQDGLTGPDSSNQDALSDVFSTFLQSSCLNAADVQSDGSRGMAETRASKGLTAHVSEIIPGLIMYPNLLPQEVQRTLLSKLLMQQLGNEDHQTNLHMHYDVKYHPEQSDFPIVGASPKDPSIHKQLTQEQIMRKKLRWMTLGGQYNWTDKVYPEGPPPKFPADTAALVKGLFPDIEPQAAIVNLYSPGDTLSLHRDVSEEVDKPLVSISLGCDCLFVVGLPFDEIGQEPNRDRSIVVRLRSGDALVMSGEARHAWHGVPKIIPDTCPSYLHDWPDGSARWAGFMKDKRVNLNVRQMSDNSD